ncbi:A/G-specific adenine glycosylase [Qiania dongpingensis]|uniref:Adenine DNA glycosylase n=1 Tax=Qiania dongpingensis TaxID=2763669 RepID=A0A7G9G6C6_9FIRM|nr:A/G-specific adenine glycosylase [Qiania dongpingensis]QNM06358.1 A/G-specific adenine glycosylase [Qiania dongpingensis]
MEERILDRLYADMEVLEKENDAFPPVKRIKEASVPLLRWYRRHARTLPWRESPTPYHVWVSEIMLQQTRVEAVKVYYERFLAELPDIQALADVEEERLMKLWEGLGYYNRARNLKRAAGEAVLTYGGKLPDSYEELLKLPGIGSYTAGAVASIAYGLPVPAVDGNVLRVISRLLASKEDIMKLSVKKKMEELLMEAMPKENAGEFNQALMEIGALVCIPNGPPRCEECPLGGLCLAKRYQKTDSIPVKTPKKARKVQERTVLAVACGSKVLIHKRPDKGLLAGLYELPNTEGHLEEGQVYAYLGISEEDILVMERLPEAKHIFSHVEWRMIGYYIKLKEEYRKPGNLRDSLPGELVDKTDAESRYALPGAFKTYVRYLLH